MNRVFLLTISILSAGADDDGHQHELRTGYHLESEHRGDVARKLYYQFLGKRPSSFERPTNTGSGGWGGFTFGGRGGGGYMRGGHRCVFVTCEDGFYCENGECLLTELEHEPEFVMGRPFVDKYGKSIEASFSTQGIPSWSSNCPVSIVEVDDNSNNNNHTSAAASIQSLGKEWTKRALGEHASIASFAAFTMALMSNQAPPKLIKDALIAAADEFRHAQTSFEIASLLLGKSVEPDPFPPSSHEFSYNIPALALATAEEGCIGETLSALAAAHDYDQGIDAYEGISDATKALLKEKVLDIVIEESQHAILAWNTVVWACTKDEKACEAVLSQRLTLEKLTVALHHYFSSDNRMLHAAGRNIFQKLIPFLSEKVNQWGYCNANEVPKIDSNESLVEQLADVIVHGVICSQTL